MLFNALRKKDAPTAEDGANNNNNNVEPHCPTVIQLYHTGKRIDFAAGLGGLGQQKHASTNKYLYASLTFQCVFAEGRQQQATTGVPTMGVWDCRVGPPERTALLLRQVTAATSTIVLTVDLERPNTVFPELARSLDVLVGFYRQPPVVTEHDDNNNNNNNNATQPVRVAPCRTTSVAQLVAAAALFGTAPNADVAPSPAPSQAADHRISLVICGILPTVPANDTVAAQSYVDKQAHNLVQYHLHKFASRANCALMFTTLDADSIWTARSSNSDTIPTVGSSGDIPANDNEDTPPPPPEPAADAAPVVATNAPESRKTNELPGLLEYLRVSALGKDVSASFSPSPHLHLPHSHDDHVISEVLLRNASCDGHWDAAKDSLSKALPPPPSSSSSISNPKAVGVGKGSGGADMETEDQWLASLSAKMGKVASSTSLKSSGGKSSDNVSVANPATNTNSSSNSIKAGGTDPKKGKPHKRKPKPNSNNSKITPKDTGDVSDFFTNLMTKKK